MDCKKSNPPCSNFKSRGTDRHLVKKIQKEQSAADSNALPKWDQPSSSEDDLQKSMTLRSKLEMCFLNHSISQEQRARRTIIYEQYVNGLIAKIQRNTSLVRGLDPIVIGSADDGLGIASSDINILIPISLGNSVVKIVETSPGCVTVKLPPVSMLKERNDKWLGWRSTDGYLCPTLANKMFHEFAKRWLEIRELSDVTIEPFESVGNKAVRVKINNSSMEVTTEVIPALCLHGFQFPFMAKKLQLGSSAMSWCMTTHAREKLLLKTINKADDNCRSKSLCILKCLRLHDEVLNTLSTYHMKTCLLHMADGEIDKTKWRKQTIDRCFMMLIQTMMKFIENGELPHFFINGINLFKDLKKETLAKVYMRLNVLNRRENELGRLLSN